MMYNRSYRQRRPPTVPINYSGNAFERPRTDRGNVDVIPIPPVEREETAPNAFCEEEKCDAVCETVCESEPRENCETHGEKKKPNLLSGLFGGKLFPRGIGNEELLLLALILLISQSGEADDLLIYLIVLLFS